MNDSVLIVIFLLLQDFLRWNYGGKTKFVVDISCYLWEENCFCISVSISIYSRLCLFGSVLPEFLVCLDRAHAKRCNRLRFLFPLITHVSQIEASTASFNFYLSSLHRGTTYTYIQYSITPSSTIPPKYSTNSRILSPRKQYHRTTSQFLPGVHKPSQENLRHCFTAIATFPLPNYSPEGRGFQRTTRHSGHFPKSTSFCEPRSHVQALLDQLVSRAGLWVRGFTQTKDFRSTMRKASSDRLFKRRW